MTHYTRGPAELIEIRGREWCPGLKRGALRCDPDGSRPPIWGQNRLPQVEGHTIYSTK